MNNIDLSYAIGLPPEKAIEYFKAKGIVTEHWDWQDTWQEAHAKAFVVAKCKRMDVLQDIKNMLQKSLDEGITLQQFKKELTPKLQAKGWWGRRIVGNGESATEVQLGSPHRLRTIYQTNMQTAYMAGRYKEFMDNVDDRPYWQYVAILDRRTRPAHAALHGKVFRYDDPFWNTHYPPLGWGCRCRTRALSAKNIKDRDLPVDSSTGRLSEHDAIVNKKTGEFRTVTAYKDPLTGELVAPDAGWSYNPGKAAWYPDLDRYDYDVAKRWIEGGLRGPDFKRFYEGKTGGNFPVAVLTPEDKELLGSERQSVMLSSVSLQKQHTAHKDLTIEDYQKIPDIIARGEVYRQKEERLIYLWIDDVLYRASLKRTDDRMENYFLSLIKTTDKKADKQVRNKYKRIR